MHSTLNSLSSSSAGLLCNVLTVWSVESLLEPEKEVDSCCVFVWRIAEWSSLL